MSSFDPTASPRIPIAFFPDPFPAKDSAFAAAREPGGSPAADPQGAFDLERALQQAYERGLAEGRAQLPWREAETLERVIAALEEGCRRLQALRRDYLVANREAAIELALAVAERLAGAAVAVDREALAARVERALEALGEREAIRVQLAPADLEELRRGAGERLERWADDPGIAVEPNPGLHPGELRVLSPTSELDGRFEAVLARLRDELRELVGWEEPHPTADAAAPSTGDEK